MKIYRHTQVAMPMIAFLIAVSIFVLLMLVRAGAGSAVFAVALFIFLVLAMFHSLTVEVTQDAVRIRFGIGPVGRTFPATEIAQARTVRNRWYYGWGIRRYPGGWLFNVYGLDAVEMVMRDGRMYRIGTDQPAELLAGIQSVLRS